MTWYIVSVIIGLSLIAINLVLIRYRVKIAAALAKRGWHRYSWRRPYSPRDVLIDAWAGVAMGVLLTGSTLAALTTGLYR